MSFHHPKSHKNQYTSITPLLIPGQTQRQEEAPEKEAKARKRHILHKATTLALLFRSGSGVRVPAASVLSSVSAPASSPTTPQEEKKGAFHKPPDRLREQRQANFGLPYQRQPNCAAQPRSLCLRRAAQRLGVFTKEDQEEAEEDAGAVSVMF